MENLRLERLKEFQATLDKTHLVSKSMVLSLEEFIGDNVITRQINPNRLTNLPSATQLETVGEIVKQEIKAAENTKSLDDEHTAEDMVTMFNGRGELALKKLLRIMNMLANAHNANIAPAIKTAAMQDEKIRYRYEGNEENTESLVDILTLPLDNVYSRSKDYFDDVRSFIYGDNHKPDMELPQLFAEEINCVSIPFNTLINIIDSCELDQATKTVPRPITLKDIIAIIENSNVIIDKLESWLDLAGKYWHSEEENLVIHPDICNLYNGLRKLTSNGGMEEEDDMVTALVYYMFTRPKEEPAI